jgi:hypothetical protein
MTDEEFIKNPCVDRILSRKPTRKKTTQNKPFLFLIVVLVSYFSLTQAQIIQLNQQVKQTKAKPLPAQVMQPIVFDKYYIEHPSDNCKPDDFVVTSFGVESCYSEQTGLI